MKIICDWNNCSNEGAYKAPVEKDNSRKYRMLCLEHVRENLIKTGTILRE